jgi:hypothetical protein
VVLLVPLLLACQAIVPGESASDLPAITASPTGLLTAPPSSPASPSPTASSATTLTTPLLGNGAAVAAGLRDPEQVGGAVMALLAGLGVAVTAADGALSLAPVDPTVLRLSATDVDGLMDMATADVATPEAAQEWPTLADYHAALAALLPDLTVDDLLDGYATAYAAAPDSFMAQLMSGVELVPTTALPRVELWALLVDGFVAPAQAAGRSRRVLGFGLHPGGVFAAGPALPAITSPDPRLSNADFAQLLAMLPALAYAIPFEVTPASAFGHEGHRTAGPTLELVARYQPSYLPPVTSSGQPMLLPTGTNPSGLAVNWTSSARGVLERHGTLGTQLDVPQATDVTGSSHFSYPMRQERGDQTGPVMTEVAPVSARVGVADLLGAIYIMVPPLRAMAAMFGDRVTPPALLTLEWHLSDWYLDDTFNQGGILGRVFGQKCDGAAGTWSAQGTYDTPGGASGNQVWNIDIAMTSATTGRGLFNYSDVQEMHPPGVNITIYTIGNASGEIDLVIDSATGEARMNARETSHTFSVTTSAGGSGHDQDAPLQAWDLAWHPGDPNHECEPPPP